MKTTIISIILTVMLAFSVNAQVSLKIQINNLENSKGNVLIAVFTNEYNFQKALPSFEAKVSKKGLRNGILTTELKLMPGTYGIAILDDENEDGEMDYNFIGIPTEGYGFSNFYHSGLSKPKFSAFSFNLSRNETLKTKLRYF